VKTGVEDLRRAVTFIRVPAWTPDREAAYQAWYDDVHIPLRMTMPGFLGAQRYVTVVGAQRYFVLYELQSPAAVESQEYLDLRAWEQSQPADSFEAPATSRPGFERGIYDQFDGSMWPADELEAPAIHITGHDPAPGRASEVEAFLADELAPSIRDVNGVAEVRQFALTEYAFSGEAASTQLHTPRPRLITISHLRDTSVIDDPAFAAALDAARRVPTPSSEEPFTMVGQCVHTAHGSPQPPRTAPDEPARGDRS